MANGSASPRSQQRIRVFDAYRGRGRRNNNLWLVYSVKTQRDWILASDRQLVHWIYYLETNSSVKWFNLVSEEHPSREIDDGDWSERDIDVALIDGSRERHQVRTGGDRKTVFQSVAGTDGPTGETSVARCRVFGDSDLKPHVQLAMRWLKALAYAAVIRDQEHTPLFLALLPILRTLAGGTVGQIVDSMAEFDSATVYGSLVRLAIQGYVDLDLVKSGFCSTTSWCLRDGARHVVS